MIEEEEEEEEEMVEEVERDSGMGSEDSQAGPNERLLPPMEPSARYHHSRSQTSIIRNAFVPIQMFPPHPNEQERA